MKRCSKCGDTKPVETFAKDSSRKDGLNNHCKVCRNAYIRARRASDPHAREKEREREARSRESIRERSALRYNKNRPQILGTNKKWRQRSKDKISAYNRAHYAANRVKYQAREAVNKAVARGELVRPTVCEQCGDGGEIQGHHDSYAREDWLRVRWLCKKCHIRHHAEENAA